MVTKNLYFFLIFTWHPEFDMFIFALKIKNVGGFVRNQLGHEWWQSKSFKARQQATGITYEINGSCTNNKLSQFAKIGNVLRQTGGSLQTTSNRNLILENKLFQKLIWQLKLAEEHTQMEMG